MPRPPKPLPPIEELRDLYLELGSTDSIGAALKVDPRRVDAALVADGFLDPNPALDMPMGEWLVEEYRKVGGLVALAKKYGVSQERLRWALLQVGVSEQEISRGVRYRPTSPLAPYIEEIVILHDLGETDSKIASRYSEILEVAVTRAQVRYLRHKRTGPTHRKLTSAEQEEARRLLAKEGAVASEVGRRFGIGPVAARRYRPSEFDSRES
jgi:hypothetical protein